MYPLPLHCNPEICAGLSIGSFDLSMKQLQPQIKAIGNADHSTGHIRPFVPLELFQLAHFHLLKKTTSLDHPRDIPTQLSNRSNKEQDFDVNQNLLNTSSKVQWRHGEGQQKMSSAISTDFARSMKPLRSQGAIVRCSTAAAPTLWAKPSDREPQMVPVYYSLFHTSFVSVRLLQSQLTLRFEKQRCTFIYNVQVDMH